MNVPFKSWFQNFLPRKVILQKTLQYSSLDGSPHKPNNLEKKFLVWTGKFKTVDEVPSFVSQSTMERCRNRMRIKIANYMMLATLIGCLAMVYTGKERAKRGESLSKMNQDWHKQMEAEMDAKKSD